MFVSANVVSFNCIAIICPSLSVPANVDKVMYSASPMPTNYALGTTATYICSNGFSVSAGDEIRTCSGDGSNSVGDWSGSEPTCSGTLIINFVKWEFYCTCIWSITCQLLFYLL